MDFDYILLCIITAILVFLLIIVILAIIEDGKYIYECITLDGEQITCDSIDKSESGLLGKRDGTVYLIKQYKRINKEK